VRLGGGPRAAVSVDPQKLGVAGHGMGAGAAVLAAAVPAAGCGSEPPRPGDRAIADVVVRVDPDGPRGPVQARTLRLRCDRPEQSRACGAAAGVSTADLAPVPARTACAELYGGPQTARIAGTLRGARVDARFDRTDACQTARWNRVRDLLGEVR
jgi:hypothetical protein